MLTKISANVNIKEGLPAIEKYAFLLLCYPYISIKELSQRLSLPVPIVSAIKSEFKKIKILEMKNGLVLTERGEMIIRQKLKLENFNTERYRCLVEGNNDQILHQEYPILETIFDNRPEVDVTVDQSNCTLETSLKRATYILKNEMRLNENLLCVGDDDLVSIANAFVYRYVFNDQPHSFITTVLDCDIRILEYIHSIAQTYNLPIDCMRHNLLECLPTCVIGKSTSVITDPPYTLQGFITFVTSGVLTIKNKQAANIYVSFGKKVIEDKLKIQQFLSTSNILIDKILENFNRYVGAQMLGGLSDLYVLKTTKNTSCSWDNISAKELYTYRPQRIRKYQCKECKKIYFVGKKQKFNTIEKLKQSTCPVCKGTIFKQIKRGDK